MGKRKRDQASNEDAAERNASSSSRSRSLVSDDHTSKAAPSEKAATSRNGGECSESVVQIIVGTYGRILHGVMATITLNGIALEDSTIQFADTFLFNAHASAVRCLALSPKKENSDKVLLASGGSDQIVNLYALDATCPKGQSRHNGIPSSAPSIERKVVENARNRELGSLQHHEGPVNVLHFPTKSKLLTAADDNTVAIARTKDWTILSSIKVPNPKIQGHASGDAATPGSAGVNDIAVHPSLKLMISVGKKEKCMRLWNLMTGKKAAVLSFERHHLESAGEGKHSSGEGQKICWNSLGEEFAISFDRGCLIYGIDCKPRLALCPAPRTRVHQLRYQTLPSELGTARDYLALSTDDGRVLFYSTQDVPLRPDPKLVIHVRKPVAELSRCKDGDPGRIKDFQLLRLSGAASLLAITVNSEGSVRLWTIAISELAAALASTQEENDMSHADAILRQQGLVLNKIGHHIGTCETGHRITCLEAFQMVTERTRTG